MRGYNNLSVCQYFSEDRAGGLRLLHFVYEPKPFDCTEFETTDCYFLYLVAEGGGVLIGHATVFEGCVLTVNGLWQAIEENGENAD